MNPTCNHECLIIQSCSFVAALDDRSLIVTPNACLQHVAPLTDCSYVTAGDDCSLIYTSIDSV